MPDSTSAANQISMCAAAASVQWPAVTKTRAEISVPLQRQSGLPLSARDHQADVRMTVAVEFAIGDCIRWARAEHNADDERGKQRQ